MTVASRRRGTQIPDTLRARVPGLPAAQARVLAEHAAAHAAQIAPKSSGRGASSIEPVWGEGWYGVRWGEPSMWFNEAGTRPRTMRELAGKGPIPMWIDDPTGREARKIPAKDRTRRTRVDAGGKRQVLIFRRAAPIGARKMVNGRSVPASYPGAPGRIARRKTTPPGQIAKANVGVRWRHPGITPRGFMRHSLEDVATAYGLPRPMITPTRTAR